MQMKLLIFVFATAYVVLAVPLAEPLKEQAQFIEAQEEQTQFIEAPEEQAQFIEAPEEQAQFIEAPEEQPVNFIEVPEDQPIEYPRFIEFPDGEGNMHLVDLEGEPDRELLDEISRNPANNLYLLFTRRNHHSAQTLVMNDENSIRSSNFNPNSRTIVIAHGWLSNQNTDLNPVIRDAILARHDWNVIILDWRRLAISDYITAVSGVPNVGRGLGQFIAFLNRVTGTSLRNFHLVGFSLGAHVMGSAGRELGGQVARVTGLDPAGPLWHYNSNRLSAASGIYVEGIHTNGGIVYGLGIGGNVGHVDFHPNGGNYQPGCLITPICDHNRAWELFAASITHNHFVGRQCSNSLQVTLNTCRGDTFRMGNDDFYKSGRGVFRVDTGGRYPF